MGLNLFVTQNDIDNGVRGSKTGCAIARAVSRLFGTSDVSVSTHKIFVGNKEYTPTPEVQQFIYDFDNGKPVRPRFFPSAK